MRRIFIALTCALSLVWGVQTGATAIDRPCPAVAPVMTVVRLEQIVTALDGDAVQVGHGWRLRVDGHVTLLTVNEAAGRLRAMVPISRADDLDRAELRRMMQANFDSAQDGRYAIARGLVWSIFVHPLRGLDKEQLIAGLAQTATLARTYGTLYSGGELQFGGGDSPELQRDLLDELLERGEDL
ncbi:MAG TPA: CesT family type III secretion system chaperone [Roseovarius sp.]